jgi:fumarate hydratase subunit beta
MKRLQVKDLRGAALVKGERILLSGTVYTARDAAHKKLDLLMRNGQPLPFDIRGAVIYYAGPTPAPPGAVIGSCGPTTSCRMDKYTAALLDAGLCGMIGKGPRSPEVNEAAARNGAVYLAALGGCGALASLCIKSSEVIAFEELGCEAVRKLCIEDFPVYVPGLPAAISPRRPSPVLVHYE